MKKNYKFDLKVLKINKLLLLFSKRQLVAFLCLFSISIVAQAQFNIGAQYRIRSEFREGYRTLADDSMDPAFVTTQRTRLNAAYTEEKLEFMFSVQDVRTWGEVKHIVDVPSIDIHEAYAKYNVNDALAFKLGRQEVKYDNKRFMGLKNWNNISVAHDIAIAKYEKESTKVHLAYAYNNDSDKLFESDYAVNFYKYMTFLWFDQKLSDDMNISVMNLFDGNQMSATPDSVFTRGTSGFLYSYGASSLSVDAAAYYQYGKLSSGQKVSAYFFHLKPSFAVNDNIKLAIGIDYFSGDDNEDPDNVSNTFSNLYGDGHGYYGHMDYFTNIPKHTKNGGFNDVYFDAQIKTGDKSSIRGTVHQFRFTNNVIDPVASVTEIVLADNYLGTEIDLSFKYKFYKKSDIAIGYSTMFAGESMEILKGGDSEEMQNWLWLSIQFKPDFFNSKPTN